jgi:hypothetical protein
MEQPLPEVLALLIADQVYQDEISGKVTILGMSSAFGATTFPRSHTGITVYAALTDGHGETANAGSFDRRRRNAGARLGELDGGDFSQSGHGSRTGGGPG